MPSATRSLWNRAIAYWRSGGAIQYDGYRDLYKVFSWTRNPAHEHFMEMYLHHEVAGRIVDTLPQALWSDPPTVASDPAFNTAWGDLLKRVPVWQSFLRTDKLAGVGRYAILVVGFDDGADLAMPINPNRKPNVIYLQPYAEGSITLKKWDTNNRSPRFGQPITYEIQPQNVDPTIQTTQQLPVGKPFDVHYSRVVHVADNALESLVTGHARLEPVFNTLTDMMKVTGGSAETFWLMSNRGLHIDIDKEMELDSDDEAALSDELREYEHELRRVIRTRGAKVTPLGSDAASPKETFQMQIAMISIKTGIPQRILMGAEAGQLASQQDRQQMSEVIASRITEYGGPMMLYPFLRVLIDGGALPQPQNLLVTWPDAFKMNPLERAQTSAQMARSLANIAKGLNTIEQTNQLAAAARQPSTTPGAPGPGGLPGKPITKPALMTTPAPVLEIITPEEARQIIGFGKHPPIFDENAGGIEPTTEDPEA